MHLAINPVVQLFFYLSYGSLSLIAFLLLTWPAATLQAANRWMGVFFLLASFALATALLESIEFSWRYLWILIFVEATRFAMGPVLYFSIARFIRPATRFRWQNAMHLLPMVFFIAMVAGIDNYMPLWFGSVVGVSVKLQLIIYWVVGLYQLQKHPLPWLRNLLFAIGAMIVAWFLPAPFSYPLYMTGSLLAGFIALRMGQIIQKPAATTPRLNENKAHHLQDQLEALMRNEKLYTDPDLTLPKLADKLNIRVHELSWLLNNGMGRNFYQYINQLRVEKAKELLHSERHEHLSILAIGFEAGFNSKTAFNSAFKKTTGATPGDFRNLVVRLDTDGQ